MSFLGMWCRVGLVRIDGPEERTASVFRVEKSVREENPSRPNIHLVRLGFLSKPVFLVLRLILLAYLRSRIILP
jgi:hypothetical protein